MSFGLFGYSICTLLWLACWIVVRIKRLPEPAAPSSTFLILAFVHFMLLLRELT